MYLQFNHKIKKIFVYGLLSLACYGFLSAGENISWAAGLAAPLDFSSNAENSENPPPKSSPVPPSSEHPLVKKPEIFFGYLKLTGTTILGPNHKKNRAVIKDLLTLRQKAYLAGSDVLYGVRIARIDEKGVLLQKNDSQKQLKLGEETGNPDNSIQLRSKGYKQVNEQEWLIRPNNLIGKTENILKILTQASIRRYTDSGQNTGFMVNEIEQGALFKKLGIEDGDVITTINGKRIDSLDAAYQLYKQIKRAPVINLNLKRQKQDIDLAYYVVPSGIPKFSVEKAFKSPKVADLFK